MVRSLTPSPPQPARSTTLLKQKFSRAPVQNPYDKFTQSDYDAWIAKLIGHLDKALAYDEVLPPKEYIPSVTATALRVGLAIPEPTQEFEDNLEGDSIVEDSFAEVKARRVNKGKARDPREGPGLGSKLVNQNEPIEVLSDEDEADGGQVLGSEDESAEQEYDEDGYEYEDEDEEQVGTSAQAEEHWNCKKQVESDEGEEYDEEHDGEGSEAATVSREDSEEDIELLLDPEFTSQQQEDEEQFLSDQESADTRSSSPQFDDHVDDIHSSLSQFDDDEIQSSDQDTLFSRHSKHQLSASDVLPDIQSPRSQVEQCAEDFHAEGDVILPRANPLSMHYLGIKDNNSATGFLLPDVVSDARSEDSGKEEGDVEGNKTDEDEELDEGIGERNVEEDSREQETEEMNEDVHLFDRLRPSCARRSLEISYFRGSQFFGSNFESGPGTNEEPIIIDSDDDEAVAPPPPPQPVVSVSQRQLEYENSTEREGSTEEEETGWHEGQEQEGEEPEGDFSDDSVDGVYADEQRQELISDKATGEKGLDVEDKIQEVSGESKLSDEAVMDIQTDKVGSFREHLSEGAIRSTLLAEDTQTHRIVQESAAIIPPFFPDSSQTESSLAEPIAEQFFSVSRDIATSVAGEDQIIKQFVSDNTVDWTELPNFPTSFPLAQQQLSSETVGRHEVPSAHPVPALATADVSTGLQTMTIAVGASHQHTVVHRTRVPTFNYENDNDAVFLEDIEEVVTKTGEEGRTEEEESREGEEGQVVDVDVGVDDVHFNESDELEEENDNEPRVLSLATSDLGCPDDEDENQDNELDDPEYEEIQSQEDSASRASLFMPLQVMTVETRTKQTEVVELETPEDRGSRSYKESGGHVFTEHLEDHWEGTSAKISICHHATTHNANEPMENKLKESPVFSRSELKDVDEMIETDGETAVSPVAAASFIPRGVTAEEAVGDDAEEPLMVAVEEPVVGEISTVLVEEPVVEEPVVEERLVFSVNEPFMEEPSVLVEEPVTEFVSPKALEHQLALEDETAGITITAIHKNTSYRIEEPIVVSFNAPADPSPRAVNLGLDLVSVRSDEVMPFMEVAIGDVEEIVSDAEAESISEQEEEIPAEGHLRSFSYDDGDVEVQSILMETQFEVFEAEPMVTDVGNLPLMLPGLDDKTQISIQEIPYVTTRGSSITIDADGAYAVSHGRTLPTPSTAGADGYFVQPGSPMMEHYGSVDFNVTPAQDNFPRSPDRGSALPTIIQLPGTPQKVLNPGGTSGTPQHGPTPVSIALDPVILRALKTNPGLFSPLATIREREQPNTSSTSVVEAVSGNVSPLIAAAPKSSVNIEVVEEEPRSTVTQESSFDISRSPTEAPIDESVREPVKNKTPGLQTLQTFFSTTVIQGKPTLPTLFDDPYPYSLSTPGPQNEVEESEEESPEQENSISTTSTSASSSAAAEKSPSSSAVRGNKQSKEATDCDADNVEDYSLPSEIRMSAEPVVVSALSAEASEALGGVEKGLMNVEAEELVNEVSGDEPDLDTNGEASQELVGAVSGNVSVEEIVIQEVDEEIASASHEGDGDAVDAHIVVNRDLVEQPMAQRTHFERSEAWRIEKVADEGGEVGRVIGRPAPEEEKDPFKLMGNDSLVPPKEVEELSAESWKEEENQTGAKDAAFAGPEILQQQPQPPPGVESLPVEYSAAPVMPQLRPSNSMPSLGYVGVIPYHLAASVGVQDLSSLLPYQRADRSTTNRFTLANSLRNYAGKPVTASTTTAGQAGTTMSTIVGTSTSDNQLPEAVPTYPEPRIDILRKVQISVERPYQADNDSNSERGTSALRAKKQKRSQSGASTTSDSGQGKGKSISSGKAVRTVTCARRGIHPQDYTSFPFIPRSPSVTPTVVSENSTATQFSPSHVPSSSSEPRPFIHAHSRRKRSKVPTTVQEQLQNQRTSSLPGSRSEILKAEDVLTKAPAVIPKNATSPVTRSHCRYHKISIAKTENGPRICFLIPGCCLNDEDLIQEEEIVDDGEAFIQGDTLVVDNIETLDFEAYLHWVLRQLVGPEILRENEIFYLPEPGEEIVRNHRPEKRKVGKPERKRSKLVEATANLTRDMSLGQSPARGNSTGFSASVLRRIPECDSSLEVTETEKTSTKAVDFDKPLTQGETWFPHEQSQRLGQDAVAYQIMMDSDEQSLHLSDSSSTPRGRHRDQGQKRSHSEVSVADEVDERKTKKFRMWPDQPVVQPSYHPTFPE